MDEVRRCADLALDVYSDVPGLECEFDIRDYYDEETDTFARTYETYHVIYVATRGTDSYRDWRHNVWVTKDWWAGIRVHSGFCRIAWSVYSELFGRKNAPLAGTSNKKLVFTGHSLGGAVACLLAAAHRHADVITFGQPRVARSKDLRKRIGGRYLRVVNGSDAVPRWPKLRVSHAGTLIYLTDDGELLIDPSRWRLLQDRTLTLAQFRRLTDHSMAAYRQQLESFNHEGA